MKERPIIFSAPMVRAILAGTKTQTRRVMKPQPRIENDGTDAGWRYYQPNSKVVYAFRVDEPIDFPLAIVYACPYGRVGDRLWVRETWAEGVRTTLYRATDGDMLYWKPSIHMPHSRSRITLEITDVRVEQLWEISEYDMNQEGVASPPDDAGIHHITPFKGLWDSINAKRGYGWAVNPWVWVISFRRLNEGVQ